MTEKEGRQLPDGCADHKVAPLIEKYYPEYWGKIHSYPQDKCACIRKVADEWGILGNFATTPLTVGNVSFNCSEQLFQMMKFRKPEILHELHAKKGMGLKMTTKSHEKTDRRGDWGMFFIDALKYCLVLKYQQCEEFRNELERTNTLELYIVEDQSSRPKKNPDAWGVKLKDGCYQGPNLLGELLMELRDKGTLEYHLPEDALTYIQNI